MQHLTIQHAKCSSLQFGCILKEARMLRAHFINEQVLHGQKSAAVLTLRWGLHSKSQKSPQGCTRSLGLVLTLRGRLCLLTGKAGRAHRFPHSPHLRHIPPKGRDKKRAASSQHSSRCLKFAGMHCPVRHTGVEAP